MVVADRRDVSANENFIAVVLLGSYCAERFAQVCFALEPAEVQVEMVLQETIARYASDGMSVVCRIMVPKMLLSSLCAVQLRHNWYLFVCD